MRWQDLRRSGNVEDRRGMSGGGKVAIGGIGMIIVLAIGLLTGQDPSEILGNLQGTETQQPAQTRAPGPLPDDKTADFVSAVLGSTEDVWGEIYKANDAQYEQPTLQMFEDATQSACGGASSAMGPFYCPADQKVYIDLDFCNELRDRFKAPGDFAVAYVVAHEVGHHVQNLMGISGQLQEQRGRISKEEYNKLSVKLELQADFFAGVWANHAQQMENILEPGDLEAALTAANAIGDDKLQKESQGYVVPDAFTHGSSQQRMYWFKKGFETGDLNQGKYEDIR
ncbi:MULTISPECIES: neutral zinc metallopeptidase [Dyadobacter]|jgi:predicted metalloprotease|uniref:Zinc metallopeptidase n=1 Tax=Dyadobacter chenhuakuii TaxID=2909339 RepID=A0A9X1QGV7_9BACT|nr:MULTISPECIES: neutral zinc metallopeptidase [Dyadobacter]MCE7069019.1 zinc metallopeptidase [Dyadobacter sp. CY327]MCF2495444.1 zinc metallopeptidase [Dyadobacter chenhuakuii]MCF2500087.1 zinc metallopeptidase [Dyadobacter chenhuakuii]MCF2520325.1 zinc metallopeptidase [Dyadobacter sp. CY351]USJ29482.1 zinc metallopeptidase [Dyadobacter chenhuakuii]